MDNEKRWLDGYHKEQLNEMLILEPEDWGSNFPVFCKLFNLPLTCSRIVLSNVQLEYFIEDELH